MRRAKFSIVTRPIRICWATSLDDLIGFHSTAFVSDKSKASLNKKLSMVQKRGYAEGELEMICKDGSSLMVWRRMRALRHTNGDFAGTVSL